MAQLVQPTTKTLRLKKGVKFWPLTMILDISSHKSRIQHGNWWMCKKDQQRGERCWIFCQKQDPGEVNCFESCESGSVLPIISLPISSSTPSSALLTSIGQETHFHRDLRPFHCIFLTICLFWRENLPILCKGCPPPTNCYDSNDWIVLWSLLLNIAQNPSLRHRPVGFLKAQWHFSMIGDDWACPQIPPRSNSAWQRLWQWHNNCNEFDMNCNLNLGPQKTIFTLPIGPPLRFRGLKLNRPPSDFVCIWMGGC